MYGLEKMKLLFLKKGQKHRSEISNHYCWVSDKSSMVTQLEVATQLPVDFLKVRERGYVWREELPPLHKDADIWDICDLTVMCFDSRGSSPFADQLREANYPSVRVLLRQMFSCKCKYCAPMSWLFMLRLHRSAVLWHRFQGAEWGRDRPVEGYFVWASTLLWAGGVGVKTSRCHCGWPAAYTHACTHTHTQQNKTAPGTNRHATRYYSSQFSCQHRKK